MRIGQKREQHKKSGKAWKYQKSMGNHGKHLNIPGNPGIFFQFYIYIDTRMYFFSSRCTTSKFHVQRGVVSSHNLQVLHIQIQIYIDISIYIDRQVRGLEYIFTYSTPQNRINVVVYILLHETEHVLQHIFYSMDQKCTPRTPGVCL